MKLAGACKAGSAECKKVKACFQSTYENLYYCFNLTKRNLLGLSAILGKRKPLRSALCQNESKPIVVLLLKQETSYRSTIEAIK